MRAAGLAHRGLFIARRKPMPQREDKNFPCTFQALPKRLSICDSTCAILAWKLPLSIAPPRTVDAEHAQAQAVDSGRSASTTLESMWTKDSTALMTLNRLPAALRLCHS